MTVTSSDGGRSNTVAHDSYAAVGAGPLAFDDHEHVARAGEEEGQHRVDAQTEVALLLAKLRETHRLREDFHREEKSLTSRIKNIESRLSRADEAEDRALPDGDGGHTQFDAQIPVASIALLVAPELYEARAVVHKPRLKYENRMKKMVEQLPVYDWMKSIPGFGELGLAQIIATTGDLSNYSGPYKVFKMMSMHVVNGRAARRVKGPGGLEQQFSPQRRAIMDQIGKALVCHGKKTNSRYYQIYLERKEYYKAKKPGLPPIAYDRLAKRKMEKDLLKHLWQQWRKAA